MLIVECTLGTVDSKVHDLDYEGTIWRALGGYKKLWCIDVRSIHCGEIVAMQIMDV